MKHNHNDSLLRIFIDFVGMILKREQCNCIWDLPDGGRCKRRNILTKSFLVAGTYGDYCFICKRCYKNDREEIDEWSARRIEFIQKIEKEQPEILQLSKEGWGNEV